MIFNVIKKTSTNQRLAEMGFIKGTIFRIIKKVAGMIQIRFNGSDVVMQEKLFEEMDYDREDMG